MYQNRGQINPSNPVGNRLDWGWQTFFDIDNNPNTGFPLNAEMGADYLIEGRHVYRHNGGDWNWIDIGKAVTRYNGSIAEMSFPRSWFSAHSTIKVAFIGENVAFGGNTTDIYPNNNASFEYHFGSGTFGRSTPVANDQRGLSNSPQTHQPDLSGNTDENGGTNPDNSGGGSFSWLILVPALWLIRRRQLR